jgi:hypothetical protein
MLIAAGSRCQAFISVLQVEMTGFYALDPRADPRADSGVEALNARYSMTGVDGFL